MRLLMPNIEHGGVSCQKTYQKISLRLLVNRNRPVPMGSRSRIPIYPSKLKPTSISPPSKRLLLDLAGQTACVLVAFHREQRANERHRASAFLAGHP